MDLISNKVLIVDNEPMSRRYTRHLAMKLGYDVKETHTVSEALDSIEIFAPSLIVIDLNLPDTDGIDLLSELASLGTGASILILSSLERAILDTADTVGTELGLRMLGAMTKPVLPAELASRLKSAQVGQPFISEEVVRLALENGEFLLHYQPTFKRHENYPWHVTGVAAFIRWNHPELGILRAGQFLSAVEKVGLLPEVTDQAILDAIQHVRYWQQRGVSLSVGITIPWHLITDTQVPDRLQTLVHEVDINPNRLTLNISDIGNGMESNVGREVLARLRLKEFQLVYDGFTNLRSSINSLISLPFTAINLDGSLVALARFDKNVAGTISAIVSIARELGMEVHAKSVADQRELEALESLGCYSARGNVFSPALPGSKVESFVRQRNKAAIRPQLELLETGTG